MKAREQVRPRRCGARWILGAALSAVLAGAGAGTGAGPPRERPTTTRPATTQPATRHLPVTLDLIQAYLERWEVHQTAVDRRLQHVRFQLLANGQARLNCLIQIKTKRDGQTFDRLYIGFLDIARVPANHPRCREVLRALATLNWKNTIGKYAWDETDGEVRLEHTVLANAGLCYADFADLLNRLTLIASSDQPTIQRLIGR